MSILIKGMDMPKNCFWCPLSILSDNRLFCEVTKNEVVRAKIDVDCPLVPVPPHGRLIDADEAVELLNSFGNRQHRREEGTIRVAIKMLSSECYTPTIVEAEEDE